MPARLPVSKCPNCGAVIRAGVSVLGDEDWESGDIAVCARCIGVFILTESLAMREATEEEMNACPRQTLQAILHAQECCLRMRHLRAARN